MGAVRVAPPIAALRVQTQAPKLWFILKVFQLSGNTTEGRYQCAQTHRVIASN